ncbi:MAG TPA: GlsB/YeaQ/YmgE family stress response membrane protein [Usitatibacteraceae bacterium]|nr:GlsB/YeaQ/YmgE family stress response membrane protein [Usitatibacteraceae bacterium]
MQYVWMILIGLVVGVVARFLHPGKENMGMIMTILLGIGGSVAATFIGGAVGLYKSGETAGFIMSVIGALVLLIIYGMVVKKKDGAQ